MLGAVCCFARKSYSCRSPPEPPPPSQKLKYFQGVKNDLLTMRVTVPMNLVCLDCFELNEGFIKKASFLQEKLIQFLADENRHVNTRCLHSRFHDGTTNLRSVHKCFDASQHSQQSHTLFNVVIFFSRHSAVYTGALYSRLCEVLSLQPTHPTASARRTRRCR